MKRPLTLQEVTSLGGKARAKKMTKKQRSEHAKKMVAARELKRANKHKV